MISHPPSIKRSTAFTLIELIVTTGIIIILLTASLGAYNAGMSKCRALREIQAGKNLITAYTSHAAENNGTYLPGMDFTVSRIWFQPYNRDITMMHASNRYPFRLAPYFGYQLKGTILVNDTGRHVDKVATPGTPMHDYVVSAFPNFGMNYYFVGGCVTGSAVNSSLTYPAECISRVSQARSILVFATGGTTDGTTRIEGFNILTPPRISASNWSSQKWEKNEDPGLHGNVDARYDGKAVCVFLDGSIRMQTIDQLRDMRLWNRNAAEQNDPNYTVPPDPVL